MFGKLKQLLSDKKLIASKEKWQTKQKKVETVSEYVNALINHLNEVASIIAAKKGEKLKGKIFRIGITHLVDNKLVPLPLVRAKELEKVFLDEFLVMPVEATSLGKLLETRKGDTIRDMEAHLAKRVKSISSQIALKWGVKSNMRMPYKTLKNSGIIFFSADVTNFFNEELFDYIESLIPDIEAYLNIANDFDKLVEMQEELVNKEGDSLHSKKLLHHLQIILEKEQNPFPEKLNYEQKVILKGNEVSGNLINLWKIDENRAAILLLESDVNIVDSARMSLYLRGMFLKETQKTQKVVEIVKALEKYYWEFLDSDPYLTSTEEMVSVFLGIINLSKHELTYSNIGFIHPIICHKDEGTVDILENTGLYFGSMDQSFTEETVPLKKGERLFLATSSLLEIMKRDHKVLGTESLHRVIKETHTKQLTEVCHVIYQTAEDLYKSSEENYDAIFAAIEILE